MMNNMMNNIHPCAHQDHAGEHGHTLAGGVPLALDGRGALRLPTTAPAPVCIHSCVCTRVQHASVCIHPCAKS